MKTIAFHVEKGQARGPVILVVILEAENLERMKNSDPVDLQLKTYSKYIPTDCALEDLDLIIAYEEDSEALLQFRRDGDLAGLMTWLERGRAVKPGEPFEPVPLSS